MRIKSIGVLALALMAGCASDSLVERAETLTIGDRSRYELRQGAKLFEQAFDQTSSDDAHKWRYAASGALAYRRGGDALSSSSLALRAEQAFDFEARKQSFERALHADKAVCGTNEPLGSQHAQLCSQAMMRLSPKRTAGACLWAVEAVARRAHQDHDADAATCAAAWFGQFLRYEDEIDDVFSVAEPRYRTLADPWFSAIVAWEDAPPQVLEMYAVLRDTQGLKDPALELELKRRIVKARPESGLAWAGLGHTLRKQDRGREAVQALRKAKELSMGGGGIWTVDDEAHLQRLLESGPP